MQKLLFVFFVVAFSKASKNSPDVEQLLQFKKHSMGPVGVLTTSNGAPVEVNDTFSLNSNLIRNANFMENMAHLVRERIPERSVHAKGAGAFGYFEVTHDITHICKAKLFDGIGKKTKVAVRFSPVTIERGGIDTSRDPKGFAIKFYTEEGNYDLVGLNIPVFPIKDPIFFPTLIHAGKRNPVTNLRDNNMLWDFILLRPESINTFIITFGVGGVQDGYRYMPGFGVHTFQVTNSAGKIHFIRYKIVPDGGIRNITAEEAQRLAGTDPDYATRDLYNAIENGTYPSWTVSIQILDLEDVKKFGSNVFDPTKSLCEKKHPLHPVGKLVLNKNPNNYFADIEQLSYNPGNLVPGVDGASDKLFEGRQLAYRDAAHYRLGINFNNILVNCPIGVKRFDYLRDGHGPVKFNGGGAPNYYPNSFGGPEPYKDNKRNPLLKIIEDDSHDFSQARDYYLHKYNDEERSTLIQNIVASLKGTVPSIQDRVVSLLNKISCDFGNRVRKGLQGKA